jgi:hypothetical protein
MTSWLPTLSIRLLPWLVVLVAALGAYLYVTVLQNKVKDLTEQVEVAEMERAAAKQQVTELTEAKSAVEARQVQAELAARKLRGDLARARGRVQTVTIPTDCDAALNWLAEELK